MTPAGKDNNRESLNEISHNAAIHLIRVALKRGARITEVYVDTVGPPEKYQAKLQALFPDIKVRGLVCLQDSNPVLAIDYGID